MQVLPRITLLQLLLLHFLFLLGTAAQCTDGYQWNTQKLSCKLNCSAMPYAYPSLDSASQCACRQGYFWNGTICLIDCSIIQYAGSPDTADSCSCIQSTAAWDPQYKQCVQLQKIESVSSVVGMVLGIVAGAIAFMTGTTGIIIACICCFCPKVLKKCKKNRAPPQQQQQQTTQTGLQPYVLYQHPSLQSQYVTYLPMVVNPQANPTPPFQGSSAGAQNVSAQYLNQQNPTPIQQSFADQQPIVQQPLVAQQPVAQNPGIVQQQPLVHTMRADSQVTFVTPLGGLGPFTDASRSVIGATSQARTISNGYSTVAVRGTQRLSSSSMLNIRNNASGAI